MLIIGPYTNVLLSKEEILELAELYSLPPQKQKLLYDYYENIPFVDEGNSIFALLESFAEYIWDSFSVVDIDKELPINPEQIQNYAQSEDLNDILINMNIMEKRYAFENELIQAVSQGQIQKIEAIMSSFKSDTFEQRVSDPIRNSKNYCIIMNTILRKAAETGGVHPLYLNNISSKYAILIEQINSIKEIRELMSEMFYSYCRLVQKHSLSKYSIIVQKAIMCIEADLSTELSLSKIAHTLNISPGYLSNIFKKETGVTITEFITKKRVQLAKQLLKSTKLQIQTIALHCGVLDVQYFSKMFKKYTGKSPKVYRLSKI